MGTTLSCPGNMSCEELFSQLLEYAKGKIFDKYPDVEAPADSSWSFADRNKKTELLFERVSDLSKGATGIKQYEIKIDFVTDAFAVTAPERRKTKRRLTNVGSTKRRIRNPFSDIDKITKCVKADDNIEATFEDVTESFI